MAPHSRSPVIVMESSSGFEVVVEQIKTAAVGNNFSIIRQQTLDDGFVDAGEQNTDQAIIYFCDFGFLNEALTPDRRIGAFLPCQVNVVRAGDKVLVMSVNPKVVSETFFDNPGLTEACERLQSVYVSILEEGTL